MLEFFKKHKKAIIITGCILLAVIVAVAAAFITLKMLKKASETISQASSYIDYQVSDVPSVPQDNGIRLNITSPTQLDTTVSESFAVITGTSDPLEILTMNGQEVVRMEDGSFAIDVELTAGKNTFVFDHKGETTTVIIRYNLVVIKAYAPYEAQQYEAGSSFVAVAFARKDCSSVTATFNGQTINLTKQEIKDEEGTQTEGDFINYVGTFTLPSGNEQNLDLGGVSFTAVCSGISKTYKSPSIVCLRDRIFDKPQIVEIVAEVAETFNGDTTDDWSRPTNSYLPKGTVDYKSGGTVYDASSENSFYTMRYGKRVYVDKKNSPEKNRVTVSTIYEGTLPETNSISLFSSNYSGKHSVMTFDTAWKAPFEFSLSEQSYANPSKQDYNVTSVTFSYVDIKFCYTTGLDGDFTIPADHPLFSSSEIIATEGGYTLRLHLKKTGGFYGWDCKYNAEGRLEFYFLNPARASGGLPLSNIKILIDAGHGGVDIGAPGLAQNAMPEAERNLQLALKLKTQLEAYGAQVVMTRSDDSTLSADARCSILRREMPDLCISIHHDSSVRSSANGAGIFCFNAFSKPVTSFVYNHTTAAGIYGKTELAWHYFYLARVSSCPVVLTENGFISNPQDFAGIADSATNDIKAQSITRGVLEYFSSIG